MCHFIVILEFIFMSRFHSSSYNTLFLLFVFHYLEFDIIAFILKASIKCHDSSLEATLMPR